MKTITRTMIAGLVASVVLGTAATSNAQSPRSLFTQVANSIQGPGQAFQRTRTNVARQFQGGPGSQGPGQWLPQPPGHHVPQPPCGGSYCPPPPPPVCHVFIVYYYDCHCGWKTYGTYHNYHAAQGAVQNLQHQGYRAYVQQGRR